MLTQQKGVKRSCGDRAIERLGIADQMKGKTILVSGAQAPELVAKGEAELGISQASEIVPVSGAQLIGPPGGIRDDDHLCRGGRCRKSVSRGGEEIP
jgi:molybdate transport system substrate-binding protein